MRLFLEVFKNKSCVTPSLYVAARREEIVVSLILSISLGRIKFLSTFTVCFNPASNKPFILYATHVFAKLAIYVAMQRIGLDVSILTPFLYSALTVLTWKYALARFAVNEECVSKSENKQPSKRITASTRNGDMHVANGSI